MADKGTAFFWIVQEITELFVYLAYFLWDYEVF